MRLVSIFLFVSWASSAAASPSVNGAASVDGVDTEIPPPTRSALAASPSATESEEASEQTRPPAVVGEFLPLEPARLLLGFGSGGAWLGQRWADKFALDNTGPTFHLTVGLIIYDVFTVSGSAGGMFPSDNASFSEDVMPVNGGNVMNADSSLDVNRFSIAVGLRTPFLALSSTDPVFAGALFADYGWSAISGSRSIANCTDCREDNLDLPGGSFWRVGVDLGAPSCWRRGGTGLTVAYQRYLGDAAISQEIQIGMSFWIH